MKRIRLIILTAVLALSFPQAGILAKEAPTADPEKLLENAITLYNSKDKKAEQEMSRLIKTQPESKQAAWAQYYLGRIKEDSGDLYSAFKSYQVVIDKYPSFEKNQEIIEKEYGIGELLMAGRKQKTGYSSPKNPEIEIFNKVIENSGYSQLAAQAEYKLALVLKGLGEYSQAQDEFAKILANYPDNPLAESAKFQIAACQAMLSRGPGYDQGSSQDAENKLKEFIKQHPNDNLAYEAENKLGQLNEKEMENDFLTGRFYEKQKNYPSAVIYYQEIIDRAPQNRWAAKAIERLRVIDKLKK